MTIIDSAAARKAASCEGLQTYEGKACKACTGTTRYVTNRACVDCTRSHVRLAYDKEAARDSKRAYRARIKEQSAASIGADILDSI